MAKIVAAATVSHSPLINILPEDADPDKIERYKTAALDLGHKIKAIDPDLLIVFGQDHQRSFFMDHMPAFCIALELIDGWGDYGTPKGPFNNNPDLARHILSNLINNGIEPSQSFDLRVDHGITQPIQLLDLPESLSIIPILINTAMDPMPKIGRCYEFGALVGEAVSSWSEDLKVVVIGSGGLSHWSPLPSMGDIKPGDEQFEALVHGHQFVESDAEAREQRLLENYKRFTGFINSDWDESFIEEFISGNVADLADRLDRNQDTFVEQAGRGVHEIRTWVTTAGAMSDQHPEWQKLIYEPIPSLITGMGITTTIS